MKLKYILYGTTFILAIAACGNKTGHSKSGTDSVKLKSAKTVENYDGGYETPQKLLQAIADEINDGKLENFTRFYINISDINTEPVMLPLLKRTSNFHGSYTNHTAIAQHMLQIAAQNETEILKYFVIQPKSEHRNLYANTFKTTGFSGLHAKKWVLHDGSHAYLYMLKSKLCFICEGHRHRTDHAINTAMIKIKSGWKVAGRITVVHCY